MPRFTFIFVIICFFACHDDQDMMMNEDPIESIAYCDQEELEVALIGYIQEQILLLNVFEDSINTCLLFDSGQLLKICNEIILMNRFDDNENKLYLQLLDSTEFVISGPDSNPEIEILVDPFNRNPLCAKVNLTSNTDLKVTANIYSKDYNSIDMTTSYEIKTAHEISILGLFQEHNNMVELIYATPFDNLIDIDTLFIQTDKVNIEPYIEVIEKQEEKMAKGSFHLISSLSRRPVVPYAIDHNGEIRWILDYSKHESLNEWYYDVGIEFLSNGNLYFGDKSTSKIYEIDWFGEILNTWDMPGYSFHHNVIEKPNANFLVTVNKPEEVHLNGKFTVEDHIIEIDRSTGQIVKEWDFKDILDENRDVLEIFVIGNYIDWLHLNSVWYDESDNSIVVSGRNQCVLKVDYEDNIKWIFGNHSGWGENRKGQDCNQFLLTPVNQEGVPYPQDLKDGYENIDEFEWSWYQHAVMLKPNGNLLLFDNGPFRNFDNSPNYSRAVEYKIDTDNMTVQQVWAYGKDRGAECFAGIASDVDYYPVNNSVLFAPGINIFNGSNNIGGRIVELDYMTKEVLFDLIIVEPGITFHRVERFDFY